MEEHNNLLPTPRKNIHSCEYLEYFCDKVVSQPVTDFWSSTVSSVNTMSGVLFMTLFMYTLSLIRLSSLSLVIKQEILGRTYNTPSWLMLLSNIEASHTYDFIII
jgi:hypothetical protein